MRRQCNLKTIALRASIIASMALAIFSATSALASPLVPCHSESNMELTQAATQVLVAIAPQAKTYETEGDALADAGLTLDRLRKYVKNESCKSDQNEFAACFWAINQILNHAQNGDESVWVPREYYEKNPTLFQNATDQLGPFVLTRWSPRNGKDPIQTDRLKVLRKRDLHHALLEHRARAMREGRLTDFEALLNRTEKLVLSTDRSREPMITLDAWNAYLSILFDPHSSVSLSDDVRIRTQATSGIGALVRTNGQELTLIPSEGSPAENAGILEGDILTEIDGEPINTLPINTARSRILGAQGSSVRLTVLRDGEPRAFTVKRENFNIPLARGKVIRTEQASLGYVSLANFLYGGCESTKKSLVSVLKSRPSGLILDLRNNPGGLVKEAACIASLFLPAGKTIVQMDGAKPQMTTGSPLTDLPLVILINSSSASASELLSGAMQEHGRALIIGERSYGKGSYQGAGRDGPLLTLAMTGGTYALPSGRSPQIVGVLPDIEVFQNPAALTEDDVPALREEDSFINPIPAEAAPAIPPFPYVRKARNIRQCLASSGSALARYNALKSSKKYADFQMLTAMDALSDCWNEPDSLKNKLKRLTQLDGCAPLTQALTEASQALNQDLGRKIAKEKAIERESEMNPAYLASVTAVRDRRALQELEDLAKEDSDDFNAVQSELKNRDCVR